MSKWRECKELFDLEQQLGVNHGNRFHNSPNGRKAYIDMLSDENRNFSNTPEVVMDESITYCSIDWEQRRYDVAKEILVLNPSLGVHDCIDMADKFITELKEL